MWTGLTLLGLCLLHGSTFLGLKTTGEVRARAHAVARPLGWVAIALVVGFVIWTRAVHGHTQVPGPVEVLAVIAVVFDAGVARLPRSREGAGGHGRLTFTRLG